MCVSGCIGDGAGGDDELMIAGLCRSCLCSQRSDRQPADDAAFRHLRHITYTEIPVSDVTLDTCVSVCFSVCVFVFVFVFVSLCLCLYVVVVDVVDVVVVVVFGALCMGCICHSEHSTPCSARCPATEREMGGKIGVV